MVEIAPMEERLTAAKLLGAKVTLLPFVHPQEVPMLGDVELSPTTLLKMFL
jgi:hypothetical protein